MFPLTLLASRPVRYLLAALAVAGLALWGAQRLEQRGWDRRDAQAQLESARAAELAGEILLENQRDAEIRNAQAIETQTTINRQAQAVRDELAAHLAQQGSPRDADTERPGTLAQSPAPGRDLPPVLGDVVLDARTVGLLNAARTGRPAAEEIERAAGRAGQEGRTPAAPGAQITGADLALSDAEIARMYRNLAARHDQLVDWAQNQCVAPSAANPKPHDPTH